MQNVTVKTTTMSIDAALFAAWGYVRFKGMRPDAVSAVSVVRMIDDLTRENDGRMFSDLANWYRLASDHEVERFCRRWPRWRKVYA